MPGRPILRPPSFGAEGRSEFRPPEFENPGTFFRGSNCGGHIVNLCEIPISDRPGEIL